MRVFVILVWLPFVIGWGLVEMFAIHKYPGDALTCPAFWVGEIILNFLFFEFLRSVVKRKVG